MSYNNHVPFLKKKERKKETPPKIEEIMDTRCIETTAPNIPQIMDKTGMIVQRLLIVH